MVASLDYTMLYIAAGSYAFSFISIITMILFIGRNEKPRNET